MKLLWLDGDATRRIRMHRFLERTGQVVSSFVDAPTALTAFLESRPEVVICDPETSGPGAWEFCRRIRSLATREELYLILLVPGKSVTGTFEVRKQEADDYLTLPMRRAELLARLRVAAGVLEHRREEARQWQRVVRVPTDSPHPILEVTADGGLRHANPAAVILLESWGWMVGQPAPAPLRGLAQAALASEEPREARVPCSERIYSFMAIRAEEGGVSLYGHDITAAAGAMGRANDTTRQALELSMRDSLTGLPHRLLLADRLGRALEQAREAGTKVGLVKVNIDNFREINEAFGPDCGDETIRWVAHCLLDEVRAGDTVCRETGDQFVLLLGEVAGRETVGALCDRLLRVTESRASLAGLPMGITLSLGFALYPDDAGDGSLLVEHADQALAEAKSAGRDCWRDYSTAAGTNPLICASHLFPRLNQALRERRLEAQYQPILFADTGAVAGFEALARWHDPELGWISPASFIPLAEARGLIAQIGWQIAEQALAQLARWRDSGHRVEVALNLSKRQLLDRGYGDELSGMARRFGVKPGWIVLEATERQSLLEDARCRRTLKELAEAGFRLSLDDFGSGHSSFDMVAELPFDELKIDMSVSRKAGTPRGESVVRAIVAMCRGLGVESVAEGVEDERLGEALRRIGATKLQGYHLSRPLTGEAALGFLETSRARRGAAGETRRSPRIRRRA